MGQPVIQPSFAAGELAPSLWARVDLAKFHVGLAKARNFFIDYRGGASNRTGTMAVGRCKQAATLGYPRNIPFTFSTVQTYTLEFGELYMRVIKDGGYVLESSKSIAGVTKANPGVFNVTGHAYSVGDWLYITSAGGMTEINSTTGYQYKVATVVDADHFTCTDLDGTTVNTTSFTTYTGSGRVARVYTLTTTYATADLFSIKYSQSADTMTLTHPSYPPKALTRSGHASWTIATITAAATMATPAGLTATPSATGDGTGYRYVVTAVALNGGNESEPSSAAVAANSKTMSLTSGAYVTCTWSAVTGAQYYNVYRQYEIPASTDNANQAYGFIGTSTGTTFIDANIYPDFTRAPPLNFDPFASSNYPGCSTYFQQRQIFGGSTSAPETLNMTKTADFKNFDYTSPARADDGIIATISSNEVNAIKHLVSMNSLIVLSGSGAWKIDGGQLGGAITPTNIVANPQAYNGCNDVRPIVINYDILYVQAKGSIVRDLTYNFYVNVYTGADMTPLANHLFLGHQITDWAWAEEPFKLIWCIRDDGALLSFTYLKEQDVYAWAHHDTTKGRFRSVCSISEGQENAVYFIVERKLNGNYVYMQERMASRNMAAKPEFNVPADLSKAWFVDCGLQYALTYPAATLSPSAADATPTVVSVAVINGGIGYTSPTVIDTSQSGATFSATVVAGVITAISVLTAGTNAVRPELQITDSTGSGAVAQALISRDIVMTASSAVFNSGMIGSMVRINDGWGTIRTYTSTTVVTVNLQQAMSSDWRAVSGAWSCTAPVTHITGLDHLNGETVAILADGNVQAQQTVASGAITLVEAASAIVIGLPITAQLQSLNLDIPGESPTVQGKRKKISAVTLRVQDSRGLKVGLDFDTMTEFKERDTQPMGQPIRPITGDERIVLDPLYSVNSQVCVQQSHPLPATVLAFIPEVTVGDS